MARGARSRVYSDRLARPSYYKYHGPEQYERNQSVFSRRKPEANRLRALATCPQTCPRAPRTTPQQPTATTGQKKNPLESSRLPSGFFIWPTILSPARLPVSPLSRVCDYESLPGYRLCSLAPAADRKSTRAVRRARGGRCYTGRVSRSARYAALAEWPRRGGELIDILRASILSVRRTRCLDPSPAVSLHTSSVDLFSAESILGCFGFLDAERAVVPKREKPAIRPARLPVVFPTSAQKKAECQSQ